jgi:phytoene dehydrogenase-like protein
MEERNRKVDVAVVGGGLAGLTAAAYTARAGKSVLLCEKASAVGGRAMTTTSGDFRFNLGPHALYAGSYGKKVLRELGVAYKGKKPSASGAFAIRGGSKHALPGGFLSLLTTGLFGLPAKLETARLLAGFGRIEAEPLARVSVAEWLRTSVRHPDVRPLVEALVRVATYGNDPERMSAGAAIAQVQGALGTGVLYLDGGWQTLVDGLGAAAVQAGARLLTSARAAAIEPAAGGWRVRFADGSTVDSAAAVIAASPEAAATLLAGAPAEQLRGWAREAIPVRAACLDLALRRPPQPRATFALGIDRPLYLSLHSAYAELGPQGGAVIHVMKYLGAADSTAKADERELEALMDLVQPGWRELVAERRFLPEMVVANALPSAAQGGLAGRPGPAVPGSERLFVVGDWVGREGMLADASFASAKRAADMLLAERQRPPIVAAA